MTKQEIVAKNKDTFVSMTNKFLDTICKTEDIEKMKSAPTYEELRRALIDEVELTDRQMYLLILLTSHTASQFLSLSQSYSRANRELTLILEQLTELAGISQKPKNEEPKS